MTGAVKLAAQQMMDNGKMCDLSFGKVTSVSPLKVQITNVLTLPQSVLVVPEHLTDYTVDVTVDWTTENKSGGSEAASFASHNHDIDGTKKIKVHKALKVGDKVALIRKTGGQSYYILDRI